MSVPKGERLATKQDLADMYQDILPYLGGMPEMLANKFSKGDLYSTGEKMIGQWTDGKPLYQKTISCGALPNSTNKDVPHGISDIDVIVSIKGVGIFNNGTTLSLPVVYEQVNESFNTKIAIDKTNISFLNSGDRSNITTTYVTLQYTKTTDTAISIGSETEYSTDEKVIGTWIDGSPLYQKTYTGLTTIASGTLLTLPSNVIIRKLEGMTEKGTPLNNYNGEQAYFIFTCANNTAHSIYQKCGSGNIDQSCYITVQYTKTTD